MKLIAGLFLKFGLICKMFDYYINIHWVDATRDSLISEAEQCAEGEGGFGGCKDQVVLCAAFEDHSLPPR